VSGADDDLEARVTALESQMRLVRADAAAARVLAGGADRDVSAFAAKLDAHTRVLNALRETQLEFQETQFEQGMAIGELSQRVGELSQRVDGLEREMRMGFAMMATGITRITELLEGIAGNEALVVDVSQLADRRPGALAANATCSCADG
jgi:chromosome segregation ATPase